MGSAVRNAAIYARVSTQMQSRSSIDDQVRKCRQWAELHDFQILEGHIYRDETLSGVGYDRPSLKLVLDLAFSIAPPFTAILVDDTSRLSRATERCPHHIQTVELCRRAANRGESGNLK
jgi:site-specific DNA recombinase